MKSLFSIAVAVTVSISAFAQSFQAPQAAIEHFNSTLTEAHVHWTTHNDQVLGQFKNDGKPAGMRYENDGTFVRKETKIQTSDLPQTLQTHLQSNGGESVTTVFKFETADVTYLINISGVDHLYDENGSLMGTSTETFSW